jgi:hypothetical protein
MKAIVLTYDRNRVVTENMICQYRTLWPGHPFRFRIPYQTLSGSNTEDREFRRSPPGIKQTVLTLLDDLDDNEWIYWCVDDKYPVTLVVPEIQGISAWLEGHPDPRVSGILFCRSRALSTNRYLTGARLRDPSGRIYLERQSYHQIWLHQFLRVEVLRHLFHEFGDIGHAKEMDEMKKQVVKPADHGLFVSRTNYAVFGESTRRGRLTENCIESLRANDLALPDWAKDCDDPARRVLIGNVKKRRAAKWFVGKVYRRLRAKWGELDKRLYVVGLRSLEDLTLPDFMGIGAQRAGTTWLYENLRAHEELFLPDVKELHYFNRNFHCPLRSYAQKFQHARGRFKGEITPAYGILPANRIQLIHMLMPELRLILILRDPVERAWSSAVRSLVRNKGRHPDAVTDEEYLAHFNSSDSRLRTEYTDILDGWLRFFPPEQLLVAFFQEVQCEPQRLLQTIFEHLRVNPCVDWGRFPWDRAANQGPGVERPNHLCQHLRGMYREQILELERRFGDRVKAWESYRLLEDTQ